MQLVSLRAWAPAVLGAALALAACMTDGTADSSASSSTGSSGGASGSPASSSAASSSSSGSGGGSTSSGSAGGSTSGGVGGVGSACADNAGCATGLECYTRVTNPFSGAVVAEFPGGFCSKGCPNGDECGETDTCASMSQGGGMSSTMLSLCAPSCTATAQCRADEGYTCKTFFGLGGYCAAP